MDAIILCVTAPVSSLGDVYNITDGTPVVFWDFVDELLSELGLPTKRRVLPRMPVMALARASEMIYKLLHIKSEPPILPISVAVLSQDMTLNIDKAKAKLGYVPLKSSHDAIRDFAAWWRTRKRS